MHTGAECARQELAGHSGRRRNPRRVPRESLVTPGPRGRVPSVVRWCGCHCHFADSGTFHHPLGSRGSRQQSSEGGAARSRWPWARPPAWRPAWPTPPVPLAQPLLLRASIQRGWVWQGPGIAGRFSHREGKKNHRAGGNVAKLQDTVVLWGRHPWAWAGMRQGAGKGHTMAEPLCPSVPSPRLSTHLFAGVVLRVEHGALAALWRGEEGGPAWGGGSCPFLYPMGQSPWKEGLKQGTGRWRWRDRGPWHREWVIFDLGVCMWPVEGTGLQAGRGLLTCQFQV